MEPDLTTDLARPDGSHRALYRRWRAQTFSRIVGQEAVVATLRNAVRTGQVAHALLFVGPRGTGKTSVARIVAKAVNCTNLQDGDPCDACPSCVAVREGRALDVIEMDAATNNRVDQIRELVERTWTAPSDLRRKVYVIDEVQRIDQGWDVLLKTLEEPPDHVVFIFCTTDPTRIRPAVLSRVQRFDFRRLTVPQIEGKLTTILEADGRVADPAAIELVARQAAGGMRDAESMLDQLLSSTDGHLTEASVRDLLGLVDGETISAFTEALVVGDALAGIAILDGLEDAGRDLGAFVDQVVTVVRMALTARLSGSAEPGRPTWTGPALVEAARRLAAIDPSRPGVGGVRLQLELALLAPRPIGPAETIASGAFAPAPTLPAAVPASVRPVPVAMSTSAAAVVTAKAPRAARTAPRQALPPTPAAGGSPVVGSEAPPDVPVASGGPGPSTVAVDPPVAADVDGLRALDRMWPSIVADLSTSPPLKPLVDGLSPDRRRRRCRDPWIPGGDGLPQGRRRASASEPGGGHRTGARPAGRRPPGRHQPRHPPAARGRRGRADHRRRPADLRRRPRRRRGGHLMPPESASSVGIGQTSTHRSAARPLPQGGSPTMSMANLQRMAQQMQQEMLRVQGELETITVDGSAGGGVVRATVTGKQELVSVTIDPSAVDPADVEMLQDLVVAAVNDALRASRELAESKMAAVTGGLRLPGM